MPSRDKLGFDLKKSDVDFPVNHPNVVGWFTGDKPATEKGGFTGIKGSAGYVRYCGRYRVLLRVLDERDSH